MNHYAKKNRQGNFTILVLNHLFYNFTWPNSPLKEPYRGWDFLKQKISSILVGWGWEASALKSDEWRFPYTRTLNVLFREAPTLIYSLKKSTSSSRVSCLNSATCSKTTQENQPLQQYYLTNTLFFFWKIMYKKD